MSRQSIPCAIQQGNHVCGKGQYHDGDHFCLTCKLSFSDPPNPTCAITTEHTGGLYTCTRDRGHDGPCAAKPTFPPDAMSFEQWLLGKLAEECAEVAQRAMKAQQFGLNEIQKDQPLDNAIRLSGELTDLYATANILVQLNLVPEYRMVNLEDAKRTKLNKYLEYSRSLGMVAPGRLVPGRTE